jgi:type IV pilus assembly protein PilW
MSRKPRQRRCEQMMGLSLIELLVSMALGVLLSAAMVSTYLGSKRSYFHDEQIARMQENGRYAMRLLSRELGMTGFYGGLLSVSSVVPGSVATDCSLLPWALAPMDTLELVNDFSGESDPEAVNTTVYTCLDSAAIASETDVLAIKRTASEASLRRGVSAAALTASTGKIWYLRVQSGYQPRWELLRPIDLLDAKMSDASLSYWEAIAKIYFIRNYALKKGDGISSLCSETLTGNAMTSRCLVEGVENLQVEFGIDTDYDGVANQYSAAPSGAQMQFAVAARIHLLIRSISELPGHVDRSTYSLGQKKVTATGDGYKRMVFSSTVLLHNRIEPIG